MIPPDVRRELWAMIGVTVVMLCVIGLSLSVLSWAGQLRAQPIERHDYGPPLQKWTAHEDVHHKIEIYEMPAVCIYVFTVKLGTRTSVEVTPKTQLPSGVGCQQ